MKKLLLKRKIVSIRVKMYFALLALFFIRLAMSSIYWMMEGFSGRKLDTRDLDNLLGDPRRTDEIKKVLNIK